MVKRIILKTSDALNDGGLRLVAKKAIRKVFKGVAGQSLKDEYRSLVKTEDLLSVNWTEDPYRPKAVSKKSYSTAWVMSPPGKGSGGHLSIFRFLQFLENSGHKVTIYLYSNNRHTDIDLWKSVIVNHFPSIKGDIKLLEESSKSIAFDAVFATGWETAYPVYGFTNSAQKFYFVQDFEPSFYATGTDSVLAENTYKFGYFGITAGGWLSKKLKQEYGMKTNYFTFGIDHDIYQYQHQKDRNAVFFYARPVTARRAFELGILSLEEFAKRNPQTTIHLAGWDLHRYSIPFKHISHGIVTPHELASIYNKCSAGLVLSLTNMSLLPPELLACGTIPVINKGDNNKLVYDNPYYAWTEAMPAQIAKTIESVLKNPQKQQTAELASKSVANLNWESSGERFIKIFESQMKDPK